MLVLIASHEDDIYRGHFHCMKFKIKPQWKSEACVKKSLRHMNNKEKSKTHYLSKTVSNF